MFAQIKFNQQENTRLAQLRDTLLPKLMSREIDVSKVNISADKLSFIVLFIQSDQPEIFGFTRNMVRLASPHMVYRQEGPVGIFTPKKDWPSIPNR